jgi:hypothetical protein
MADEQRPRSIAEMPAQQPTAAATAAEARGRFFNIGNGFNVPLPPVPDRLFTAEPVRAPRPSA